jgi:hypothetical protein
MGAMGVVVGRTCRLLIGGRGALMSCKRCRCECNERIQPTSYDFRATQHDHDLGAEDQGVDGAIFLRPRLELEMGVFHRHLRSSASISSHSA